MESIHSDMKTFSQMLDELGEEIAATDADIYDCPICRDTGWVSDGANAYPCSCRKKQQEQNRFALPPKLAKTNFSNFLLDKYSREIIPNREISYRNLAEKALISAKDFASAYLSGGNPPGFILIGPTGCGKPIWLLQPPILCLHLGWTSFSWSFRSSWISCGTATEEKARG